MNDKLTPKAQAETLMREMLKGKKVHEFFTESMQRQLLISGHPIGHWEDIFKIRIPTDNLNPAMCREIDMKLMELNQEATFLYNMAVARSQMIKHGNSSVFMSKFHQLTQEYQGKGKRLPAQGTLENLARHDNLEVESAQAIADIEVKFWKSILEHLGRCQSILKNASLMIATELKSLSNERQLDQLERQGANNE